MTVAMPATDVLFLDRIRELKRFGVIAQDPRFRLCVPEEDDDGGDEAEPVQEDMDAVTSDDGLIALEETGEDKPVSEEYEDGQETEAEIGSEERSARMHRIK